MKTLQLEHRTIGAGHPCFVIAEVGVNHNGDLQLARRLVREARLCGADCVKFQTFRAERVAAAVAPKAAYQLMQTDPRESQLAMLRDLELPAEAFADLIDVCRNEGVQFLSTPYSVDDAELLAGLGVAGFKIASGQLVELPFLEHVARFGKPIILSTGLATLAEVEAAVAAIRHVGAAEVAVLQCTTNYPSRLEDANLRAMLTMRDAVGAIAGYSDHTKGGLACWAAVALGASIVEKHFTVDRNLPGPDHQSSAEPGEFRAMVDGIRQIESALGTGEKIPCEREAANLPAVRRSIATARALVAGHRLAPADLQFLRPASGLPPAAWTTVVGRTTRCALPPGTLLEPAHLA